MDEPQTHQSHDQAEGEEEGKLVGARICTEIQRGNEQSDQAANVIGGCFPREVTAANILRDQARDPREPAGAGNSADEVKAEERTNHQRELALLVNSTFKHRHGDEGQNKNKANRPASGDEAFVANTAHVIRGRNLENHHDRRETGDQPHHRRAGAEAFGVEKNRRLHHDHYRDKVEKEKGEEVVDPLGKARAVGSRFQAALFSVVPTTLEGRNDSSNPAQTSARPR